MSFFGCNENRCVGCVRADKAICSVLANSDAVLALTDQNHDVLKIPWLQRDDGD